MTTMEIESVDRADTLPHLTKVCTRTAPWGHPLLTRSGFPYALRGRGSEAAAFPRLGHERDGQLAALQVTSTTPPPPLVVG